MLFLDKHGKEHVQKHLTKLKKKHDQVRKKLFKLLQKVARHKGSWKPMYKKGKGLTVPGAGFDKRRGRKGKVRKRVLKKRKLPKWVTRKTVPRTFPKRHKDMTKAAGAFSDHLKSFGNAVGSIYNKHKDTINKIGSAIGGAALNIGTQFVQSKIQQAQSMAQQKMQQANAQFNAHLQNAQSKAQMAMQQAQNAAMGYGQQAYGQAQGYLQQGQQMAQGYVQQGQQAVAAGVQAGKTAAYDAAGNLLGYF